MGSPVKPIVNIFETGADLIKGRKSSSALEPIKASDVPLMTIDELLAAPVTKVDDTKTKKEFKTSKPLPDTLATILSKEAKNVDFLSMDNTAVQKYLFDMTGHSFDTSAINKARIQVDLPSPGHMARKIGDPLKEFFSTIPNIDTLLVDEIWALPGMRKFEDQGIKYSNFKVKLREFRPASSAEVQKKLYQTGRKKQSNIAKNPEMEADIKKFLTENDHRTISNSDIVEAFPQYKHLLSSEDKTGVYYGPLKSWRKNNNLQSELAAPGKIKKDYNPLLFKGKKTRDPELSKKANPIKHLDFLTDKVTKVIDEAAGIKIDKKRTKLVQAHSLGWGRLVNPVDYKMIKSKMLMIPDKFLTELESAKYFLTKTLNNNQRSIENNLIKSLLKKYDLLGHRFKVNKKGDKGSWTKDEVQLGDNSKITLKQIETDIEKYRKELFDMDAQTVFYNPITDKLVTYGKPIDEIPGLANLAYQVKTGLKKEEGGLIRPNMALGGDMAQFTEMESVVPDLNPDEAEVQLAMSFKNPFKLKKTPPLIDDVDTNLKITDQGPGTAKKATQTHTLDAGVGSDSIFYLKSDLELANAVQDKMTGQQWLGYLTKKGVSPTELDEFGLKNLIYNMGGWDESTKKWKNNKAISKSDLIAAYKNEKPIITYKINQVEPFEKGVKDFALFMSKRKSGGSYYHGDVDPMGDTRGLMNKPQDIAGDTMRQQLMKYFGNNQDFKKDWAQNEKAMVNDFNRIYKQFYGIDNVVENGIPEGMKIPFYSRNLLDRFNRLRKGEGFYFAKGKGVQHEGTQFMPGGTGYIEIPFTYNPNPKGKRATEPRFTFGEGHFTNPEGNNPVFWMRASERVDEQGNRILFIEEIQSDMHQKVKQKPETFSYAKRHDSPGMVDRNIALKQFDNLKIELEKVSDQIDKITGHTDPSATTIMERLKVKRESIRTQMADIQNSIQDAAKQADEVFPEGPFKKSENQTKIALKTAINLAQKEGFDGVAIVTGKAKNKFANASGEIAKGNIGFYDQIAVKAMKSTAKNLDLDFSATNIKDGTGNTWAKIPVINLKETTINTSVDMYKAEGGYIHHPSFVDVVPTL